jgi:hypothetical protein
VCRSGRNTPSLRRIPRRGDYLGRESPGGFRSNPCSVSCASTVRFEVLRDPRDDLRVCELVNSRHGDRRSGSRRSVFQPVCQLLLRLARPDDQYRVGVAKCGYYPVEVLIERVAVSFFTPPLAFASQCSRSWLSCSQGRRDLTACEFAGARDSSQLDSREASRRRSLMSRCCRR